MDRFGIDYSDVRLAEQSDVEDTALRDVQDRARKRLAEARKNFDETYSGWIVAGPVIVPNVGGNSHIFLAAARRRGGGQDIGRLAQSTVYDLEADGQVVASTALPRLIDGDLHSVFPGALVWGCERGSLVRFGCSEADFSEGFAGPAAADANDAKCRGTWYREYAMRMPDAWFSAAPPRHVAAFAGKYLYRPAAAYLRAKGERVYRFVINEVDLETSLDRDLTLAVPYNGDFSMPESGYADLHGSMHSGQPHLLEVSNLSVVDDVLRLVMKRPEKDVADVAIEFQLPDRRIRE